jgi:hypothetical protein
MIAYHHANMIEWICKKCSTYFFMIICDARDVINLSVYLHSLFSAHETHCTHFIILLLLNRLDLWNEKLLSTHTSLCGFFSRSRVNVCAFVLCIFSLISFDKSRAQRMQNGCVLYKSINGHTKILLLNRKKNKTNEKQEKKKKQQLIEHSTKWFE